MGDESSATKRELEYPEKLALQMWDFDGVACSIVRHPLLGHLCGYARFPKRPTVEQGYRGILTYIPVHGGITYAEKAKDGTMVYGFDCCHGDDAVEKEFVPDYMREYQHDGHVWTVEEVHAETERMVMFIKGIVKYEEAYLLAPDNQAKAAVLDDYFEEVGGHNIGDNFGATIRVMFGGDL